MESLLVTTLAGFCLVAFGAMAIVPLLIDTRVDAAPEEDRIISIQPVPFERLRLPIDGRLEQRLDTPAPAEDRPVAAYPHRHAA